MAYGSGATLTHRAVFYCGTAEFVESTAAVVERAWAGRPCRPGRSARRSSRAPAGPADWTTGRPAVGRHDDRGPQPRAHPARRPDGIRRRARRAAGHHGGRADLARTPAGRVRRGRRPTRSLINLAFDGADVTVVCPYDAEHLAADALADARSTHPEIGDGEGFAASPQYADPESVAAQAMQSMPPPPAQARAMSVHGDGDLSGARQLVMSEGERAGLTPRRRDRFTLAAHEATANAVRHGGGSGELTIWRDGDDLVCQVQSALPLADAMAGRRAPQPEATRGRGLVLVNEICDLVQVSPGPRRDHGPDAHGHPLTPAGRPDDSDHRPSRRDPRPADPEQRPGVPPAAGPRAAPHGAGRPSRRGRRARRRPAARGLRRGPARRAGIHAAHRCTGGSAAGPARPGRRRRRAPLGTSRCGSAGSSTSTARSARPWASAGNAGTARGAPSVSRASRSASWPACSSWPTRSRPFGARVEPRRPSTAYGGVRARRTTPPSRPSSSPGPRS